MNSILDHQATFEPRDAQTQRIEGVIPMQTTRVIPAPEPDWIDHALLIGLGVFLALLFFCLGLAV